MADLQQASPIPTNIPKGVVVEWTVDDVRNWLSQSMQLPQYLEQFEENEIAGDVLVHLDHEALKDLDVTSVGHRLYLLKQIYNLKIAHGVKFEKDDYVPISAPKGDDDEDVPPAALARHLRDRDAKIQVLEFEIKRMNDQMYKLKEELVPVLKTHRERPLPTPDPVTPNLLPQQSSISTATSGSGSSLARKFSTKKLFLGSSRKASDDTRQMEISKPLMSPTYINGISEERRPESPRSPTKTVIPITPGLVPPTPYGSGYGSTGSEVSLSGHTPTSSYTSSPVTPRTRKEEDESTPRKRSNSTDKDVEKEGITISGTSTSATASGSSTSRTEGGSGSSGQRRLQKREQVSNPMKTFRVNLDDPCWKVLPIAMKKYDVKGREEDYRLYIIYGDVANEKPLIIFQQLQKEGRNPLFMLRYQGKNERERDRDRDREEYRNGSSSRSAQKEDDLTSPKTATAAGTDGR